MVLFVEIGFVVLIKGGGSRFFVEIGFVVLIKGGGSRFCLLR